MFDAAAIVEKNRGANLSTWEIMKRAAASGKKPAPHSRVAGGHPHAGPAIPKESGRTSPLIGYSATMGLHSAHGSGTPKVGAAATAAVASRGTGIGGVKEERQLQTQLHTLFASWEAEDSIAGSADDAFRTATGSRQHTVRVSDLDYPR